MAHQCQSGRISRTYVVTVRSPADGTVFVRPTMQHVHVVPAHARVGIQSADREPLLMAQARRRLVEFELVERATILTLTVIFALLAIVLTAGAPDAAAICATSSAATSGALILRRASARHDRSGSHFQQNGPPPPSKP